MKNFKYTKERLAPVVKISTSWADVCRKFGVSDRSGVQWHIKKAAVAHGIDFSHFKGHAWSKGKSFSKRSIESYLVEDSKIGSHALKIKLIKEGLKEHRCEQCSLNKWNNKPIPLELDHINGKHKDNRRENIRLLCPNCHAQTDTYSRPKASKILNTDRICACGKTKDKNADKCLSCFREKFPSILSRKICECGKEKSTKALKCKVCESKVRMHKTRIEWPTLEELRTKVKNSSYVQVGKELGVSDNAVRKHLRMRFKD